MSRDSEEGGELLSSDDERKARFGQADHLKIFGRDLPDALATMAEGSFSWDDLSDQDRAMIGVEPNSNRFLIWRKDT